VFSTLRRKPLARTKALVDHFRRCTGDRLAVRPGSRRLERLGLGRADIIDGSGFENRYGAFYIVVFADPEDEDAESSTVSGDRGRDGITWSVEAAERGRDAGIPKASATKFYGRHIRLSWFRDDDRRTTDERWEKLDQVLTDFFRA
jgi:hypothetical protein